jgi:alpha-1,2-mannosyltransferase
MGHAFTYPFVRLFTGSEMVIAAYTHYPTVSADMVRRVRSREVGVESGGRKPGWIRTVFKLV